MKAIDLSSLPDDATLNIQEVVKNPTKNKNIQAVRPVFPIARSTWYEGIKSGRFPKPIDLGNGLNVWRVKDIKAVVNGTFNKGAK